MAKSYFDIITAVKPKKRSDQLLILAALYDLDAASTPATSTEVVSKISQYKPATAPKNVAASLRKYQLYVEPTTTSRPIRWKLRQSGIQKLESLSGIDLSTIKETPDFLSDIAIVCALEHPEFSAVKRAFGGQWKVVGDARFAHVYRECTLTTKSGKELRVVATVSTLM